MEQILEDKNLRFFSPKVTGISPKYFHLFSTKIIDGEKRVGLNEKSTNLIHYRFDIINKAQKQNEKLMIEKKITRKHQKNLSSKIHKAPLSMHQISKSIQLGCFLKIYIYNIE